MHALNGAPSTAHSKVLPVSLELNAKLALVELVEVAGAVTIVVCGAVRSTVHVDCAGLASVLPAVSIARTRNVWLPAARAV